MQAILVNEKHWLLFSLLIKEITLSGFYSNSNILITIIWHFVSTFIFSTKTFWPLHTQSLSLCCQINGTSFNQPQSCTENQFVRENGVSKKLEMLSKELQKKLETFFAFNLFYLVLSLPLYLSTFGAIRIIRYTMGGGGE